MKEKLKLTTIRKPFFIKRINLKNINNTSKKVKLL